MGKQVRVLVGTTKGAFFFHSDENRKEWRMTGPHLPGWEVYSVLGDRRNPNRVYAGTSHFVYGPTIRVSEDLGENWKEIPNGPRYAENTFELKRIWQLAQGRQDPDTFYAGVEDAGLFVSHDNGESWNEVVGLSNVPSRPNWFPGGGGLCLHTILNHPTDPDRLWVAISAVGIFRSDDGGQSWTLGTKGLPAVATGQPDTGIARCVHKVVLDPSDPDKLYMQFHGGVFRSTDGGLSWSSIESGLPGNFGFPMCASRAGDLYVVPLDSDERRYVKDGKLRVYRSRDHGDSWQPLENGLPDSPEFVGVLRDSMDVDEMDPAGIYFGTTSGELFFSADGGEEWSQIPAQLPRITMVRSWVTEG